MGGFSYIGFMGRVPCPLCGSTDCAWFDFDKGIMKCGKKDRTISEDQLYRSAIRSGLPRYDSIRVGQWELRLITFVGDGYVKWYTAGHVHIHNNEGVYRGECVDIETAKAWCASHRDMMAFLSRESASAFISC